MRRRPAVGLGILDTVTEPDARRIFELPSKPTPRERYTTRVTATSEPNAWQTVHVDVLDGDAVIASYDRNYSMLQTFEPFRQGDRPFALISTDYTATSVMDLQTGEIIAAEDPDEYGFCPVGFYVPDWWDLHDGSALPGSTRWRPADDEWPGGDFGFVWGCVWGDDSSWKVQHLDLSSVRAGVIRRDDGSATSSSQRTPSSSLETSSAARHGRANAESSSTSNGATT